MSVCYCAGWLSFALDCVMYLSSADEVCASEPVWSNSWAVAMVTVLAVVCIAYVAVTDRMMWSIIWIYFFIQFLCFYGTQCSIHNIILVVVIATQFIRLSSLILIMILVVHNQIKKQSIKLFLEENENFCLKFQIWR